MSRGYMLDKSSSSTMEARCLDCSWAMNGTNVGGTSATHAGAHSHRVVYRKTSVWVYDGRNQP